MASVGGVRRQLSDLAEWLPLLGDVNSALLGLHGASFSLSGPGGVRDGLAFGLDRTMDSTDVEGGCGVRTEAGALELLGSFARAIAADRGERLAPGVISYLLGTLGWAQEHADWEALAGEVSRVHATVARLTGHAPVAWGSCAHCAGEVVTDPGREGIPEWGECSSCGAWYRDGEDLTRARLDELRSPFIPEGVFVEFSELRRVWPGLTKDQVKKWRARGKVACSFEEPRRYRLKDVNTLMLFRSALPGLVT